MLQMFIEPWVMEHPIMAAAMICWLVILTTGVLLSERRSKKTKGN